MSSARHGDANKTHRQASERTGFEGKEIRAKLKVKREEVRVGAPDAVRRRHAVNVRRELDFAGRLLRARVEICKPKRPQSRRQNACTQHAQ